MRIDKYPSYLFCSQASLWPVTSQLLYRMSDCNLHPDLTSYVKYIPADVGSTSGYLEQVYNDSNCLILFRERWYEYGCNDIQVSFSRRYQAVPCVQACNDDGYGCQPAGYNAQQPKDYCPMTQLCKVQGGTPKCAFSGSVWEGRCEVKCSTDKYGCSPVDFVNGSVTTQVYAPDLSCSQTQDCISAGHTPTCTVVGSTVSGTCEDICVVQRAYSGLGCSGVLAHTQVTQAYSCQTLWDSNPQLYYRLTPTKGNGVALYSVYNDSGCVTEISNNLVSSGACYSRYKFDVVNCDEICADYGCSSPYVSLERPIQNCPLTEACVQHNRIPWCQRDTQFPLSAFGTGRCDEICVTALTNTNLIGCTATDVRTVIRPGECQLLIDPNGANRYFQIEFYDGLQAAVNLFSDPMCSIETTTYVFNQSSCNFGFTWNYDMCYNIDGTEECALQKAFQGPVIRTRYVPTLKADCGDKAPVCLDQGDLVCMDQCVAYEIGDYAAHNVGKMSQCYYDNVFQFYAKFDYFGDSSNGAVYLLRFFSDPFCFNKVDEYYTGTIPLYPNRLVITNLIGNTVTIDIVVEQCNVLDRLFSPSCVPFLDRDQVYRMIPDDVVELSCSGGGLTPVCQRRSDFVTTDLQGQNYRGWNIECIDLTLLARDFSDYNLPQDTFNRDAYVCRDYWRPSLLTVPPVEEYTLQISCFQFNDIYYSLVPISSGDPTEDLDILLYSYGSDSTCTVRVPQGSAIPLRNGQCFFEVQFLLGSTDAFNTNFLCKLDGFGCRPQVGLRPENANVRNFNLPGRNCPATKSCIESGRTPVCADDTWGRCDDIVAWAESFSFGGCPNSFAQAGGDWKSLFFTVGQCVQVQNFAFYDDFGGFPNGLNVFTNRFVSWFSPTPFSAGYGTVLFQFYASDNCGNDQVPDQYLRNWPWSFEINNCYQAEEGQDVSTWKAFIRENVCGIDGFGCPQQNFIQSTGTCEVLNCKPQYSCESTQACLAGGPLILSPSEYALRAVCVAQGYPLPTFFYKPWECVLKFLFLNRQIRYKSIIIRSSLNLFQRMIGELSGITLLLPL